MNLRAFRTLSVWARFCISATVVFAQDNKPQPFSVDLSLSAPSGKLVSGRFYYAPPKLRMDVNDLLSGASTFVIIDSRKQTMIGGNPRERTYEEKPVPGKSQAGRLPLGNLFFGNGDDPCAGHTDWVCKRTGTEEIEGRICEVWQVSNEMGESTWWIDKKLHLPTRYKNAEGFTMEYSHIQEGPPDPAVFSAPPDYKRVESRQKNLEERM